jgi:hypothetical protein
MATFSFGFVVDESTDDDHDNKQQEHTNDAGGSGDAIRNAAPVSQPSKPDHARKPFHFIDSSLLRNLVIERATEEIVHDEILVGDVIIRRVDTDHSSFVEASSEIQTELSTSKPDSQQHHPSDLRPGVYEGGGAVWEGCIDLLEYLSTIQDDLGRSLESNDDDDPKAGLSILELGCGHALPALYVLKQCQPTVVVLTDYNDHVLKDVAVSNLVINHATDLDDMLDRVVLGAGDWMELSEHLFQRRTMLLSKDTAVEPIVIDDILAPSNDNLPVDGLFDLILAAETLYTPQAAKETAYFIAYHLQLDGTAYIATKRYYFGVGGGADAFRESAAEHGLFVETVKVVNTGKGNVREVLKVSRQAYRSWF